MKQVAFPTGRQVSKTRGEKNGGRDVSKKAGLGREIVQPRRHGPQGNSLTLYTTMERRTCREANVRRLGPGSSRKASQQHTHRPSCSGPGV